MKNTQEKIVKFFQLAGEYTEDEKTGEIRGRDIEALRKALGLTRAQVRKAEQLAKSKMSKDERISNQTL